MLELSERIASDDFAQIARHPDFPNAFTRNRKLPLPALIGALLSMRNQSQQAMLDGLFASPCSTEGPRCERSLIGRLPGHVIVCTSPRWSGSTTSWFAVPMKPD